MLTIKVIVIKTNLKHHIVINLNLRVQIQYTKKYIEYLEVFDKKKKLHLLSFINFSTGKFYSNILYVYIFKEILERYSKQLFGQILSFFRKLL